MSSASEADRVGDRTRRGLSWTLASAISTNALRLAVVAVLGRALSSADFGIVAAALSVNVLFYSVRDLGVGQALVQQKDIDAGHLKTAFAVSAYLGLSLSLLLLITAPLIEDLYRIDGSANVIRATGLLFVLRGIAITSRMMCQRAMNFRAIAVIDAVAFAVGSMVSMGLALAGAGPWSLIAGYLVEEGLSTLLFIARSPPPVGLTIDRDKLRELMRFGGAQTVSQIAATLATYADNIIVGHTLGARLLGFYTRAYELIRFPSAVFDNILGTVLFPAFARWQDDRERLAVNFRRAMFANAAVLLPASAALFVVAPEAIRILMGSGWDPAVLPFRILVLTMMMRTSAKVGQMISSAVGGIRSVAIVNILYMVVVVAGAVVSIRWGIAGVATSTAIAITFVFGAFSVLAMRLSGLPLRELAAAHVPGILLTVVAGSVAHATADPLREMNLPTGMVFAAVAAVSIAATLLVVGFAIWRRWGDFSWLGEELTRVRRRVQRGKS